MSFLQYLARHLCDNTCLAGWLSVFPAHSQSSKPIPASLTHKQVRNLCIFLSDFFKVLPSHMKVLQDHYRGHHATSKWHTSSLIDFGAAGKCKNKSINLNRVITVTQPHWLESAWYTTQGCPFSDLHSRSCYHWTLVYATCVECSFYISQFPADVNCTQFRSLIYQYFTAKAEVWISIGVVTCL